MKANTILEKLASASVGSYGQEVWLDLVNEAKENLQKIQVCCYFSSSYDVIQTKKELRINFICFLLQTGQPVCSGLLHKCSVASVQNHSGNAELC